MKTILLTQKSICAFLGLVMAMTIVWKANLEMKQLKSGVIARIEITKPTISTPEAQSSTLIHPKENCCFEQTFAA
ncbi:hypothetical protein [Algoriphagus namhaensis]